MTEQPGSQGPEVPQQPERPDQPPQPVHPQPQRPQPLGALGAPGEHERRLRQARIRREPRYSTFVVSGVVLGFVAALLLTFTQPEGEYSYAAVLGYLAVVLGLAGGLLGALVAVLLTRRR